MSEYSKQYCEKYMAGHPHDFDLDEMYAQLQNGEQIPLICEGFGFTHISKTDEGVRQVVFTNYEEEGDDYKFIDFDDIDDQTYRGVFVEAENV